MSEESDREEYELRRYEQKCDEDEREAAETELLRELAETANTEAGADQPVTKEPR